MFIEVQSGAFMPHVELGREAINGTWGSITAFSDFKNIYLSRDKFILLFRKLCHEFGHVTGEYLSYQQNEVLSPSEVLKARVTFDANERRLLTRNNALEWKKTVEMSKTFRGLAQKILMVYTKGNANLNNIGVYNVSQSDLQALTQNGTFPQARKTDNGKTEITNASWSRDFELAPAMTELCCLFILETSLRDAGILLDGDNLIVHSGGHTAQQRAINIATRVLREESKNPPSLKDLRSQGRV